MLLFVPDMGNSLKEDCAFRESFDQKLDLAPPQLLLLLGFPRAPS